MERFLREIYMSILYEWVRGKDYSYLKEEGIYFEKEDVKGVIHFWPNCIIEEEIFDFQSKERVFYLHFQVHNMNRVKLLIKEFFDFFVNYKTEKTNILLCCSGGLTTSYFAHEMNLYANKMNMPYNISAVSYTKIDDIIDDYQFIMLAPQISYLEARLREQFPTHKIISIPTKTFATSHYIDALKLIDEEVKEYEKNFTRM